MLTIHLAEEIVQQTMLRLHHNVNVFSPSGVILASGDKMRIDKIHEGALFVAKTKQTLIINEQNVQQYRNAKLGINMPILYQGEVIGVIGVTGDSEELLEIASLVQLTTEMMVHQAIVESKSEWQQKNMDYIFEALVQGSKLNAALKERIQKLSFPLNGPFQIILLNLDVQDDKSKNMSIFFENSCHDQAILSGSILLHEYYILLTNCCKEKQKQILQALRQQQKKLPSLQIGIGPTVQDLTQLPYAYNGAKTALEFASITKKITYFEDVELYSLMKNRDSEEVKSFQLRILQNLNSKYIDTLQNFFTCNLQLTQCAQQMNIHRHTLTYRLQKIKELTGYDPQFFEDAVILKMACTLKQFKPD